ncbi:hypothetical protein CDL15_Pgr018354 [Punica granatum]|uniref:Uncharacterized protein n=1 Tax=Punica granatum TaxID=22663 RepID=A0A218WJ41_PUNGR|nr:hypothetical protein CDL15_Pgr018354 [Punica granatum]
MRRGRRPNSKYGLFHHQSRKATFWQLELPTFQSSVKEQAAAALHHRSRVKEKHELPEEIGNYHYNFRDVIFTATDTAKESMAERPRNIAARRNIGFVVDKEECREEQLGTKKAEIDHA